MGPFDQARIHDAVLKTLSAAADIPDHHGFATVVDTKGAHVALLSRVGNGWNIEVDGGYNWTGPDKGAEGQFVIGKSW